MKIGLICAAAAAVIAVSAGIVAVAYGNSAQDKGDALDVSEQSIVSIENKETPESDIYDADSESNPAEDKGSVSETENSTVKAVNSINRGIAYIGKFSDDGIPGRAPSDDDFCYSVEEDSDISLGYLKDFFGNDNLPVDGKYKDSLLCYMHSGVLEFDVEPGAAAVSPVGGRVVGVCVNKYNGGLGNTVAVEFDGRIFVMAHLDSVSVKTGDEITAGQTLGVCGNSGMVMYNKTQLRMILMERQ